MKRKHLLGIVIWIVLLFSGTALAKKVAVFPGLLVPSDLQMDDKYLYITETFSIYMFPGKITIFIYSIRRENNSLVFL